MMITIVWMDGIPCILLPVGAISFADMGISNPTNSSRHKNYTKLQKIKENDCLRDLLGELKDKFKDKKK